MTELVLFYIFGITTLVSALLVITRRNVVHSAVCLAATLLSVAGLFLTMRAEFLAGVQVIVYVGGILVLFVFVIMLIALERSVQERHYNKQWLIALIVAGLLIAELLFVLLRGEQSLALAERPGPVPSRFGLTGNSQLVGETLYTTYLLPFEIASVLLLVAIVGAVALARRKTQVE